MLADRLANEFAIAVTKMQETNDIVQKVYFFSAFYGETQRVLNWEWDRDLALMFVVLHDAYQQLTVRLQASDRIGPGKFPAGLFDALTQVAQDLTNYVSAGQDNDEEFASLLGRIAELGYAVTGNGNYLYEKGLIKF